MRKILTVLLISLASIAMQGQHVFNKGDVMFNIGVGAPYQYGLVPTINASGEVGVIPTGDIGIVSFGGLAEIQFAQYTNPNYDLNRPIFIIGPRGTWHLQVFESDVWDVYGGVGFGLKFWNKWNNGNRDYDSSIGPYGEIFFGGRWMFSPGVGLFAEVGGGTRSWGKFGITFGI